LKPDNIMVTKGRGGADTVKVVDFGIAKAIGGEDSGQKVTKTGLVIGTPEFMSPEQLSGDTVDGRSDLYSLALVFFRMLSGKLPFEATTVQETMIKRLTDEPATLTEARPDLAYPPGLQPVFDTALARTPAERYQTVAKFAADVAAVTGRPVTRSVPPTEAKTQLLDPVHAAPTVPLRVPRKRALLPIAATAVVILASGGTWMVLNGGSKAPADTVRGTGVARDTAKPSSEVQSAHPTGATRNARRVGDSLNVLLDRIDTIKGPALRNAAIAIYFTNGVSDKDRALAAYLVANGFAKMDSTANTCTWARRAVSLDPVSRAYAALQKSCAP
jgi:hypothetical protein